MKGSVVGSRVVLGVMTVEGTVNKVEESTVCSTDRFSVSSPSQICPSLSSCQLSAVELGLVTFTSEEALTCGSRN